MPDDMLDEYAAMLPEPERTRFREDVDKLIRRTLTRDHAHQAVHLAWRKLLQQTTKGTS